MLPTPKQDNLLSCLDRSLTVVVTGVMTPDVEVKVTLTVSELRLVGDIAEETT